MLKKRLLPLMTLALASIATSSVQPSEQNHPGSDENSKPIWHSPYGLQEAENTSWTIIDPLSKDTTYAEQFHVLRPLFSQNQQTSNLSENSIGHLNAPFEGSGFVLLSLVVTIHGLRRRQGLCKNT